MLLGAHVSVAGGVDRAMPRARALRCSAVQIFTGSCRRWSSPPIHEERAARFRALRRRSGVRIAVAHAGYLPNLASPDAETWRRSVQACHEELHRCRQLGLDGLVLHPGCHRGDGPRRGLERVARALDRLADALAHTPVLLECTAGQGTALGARFEELGFFARRFPPERVAFCLDTCHLHAAGYDLSQPLGVRRVLRLAEEILGPGRIRAVHLNDSVGAAGCRRDRHAHIGEGTIGLAGFRTLLRSARLRGVAGILETPKADDGDRRNLRRLRTLAAGTDPSKRRRKRPAGRTR